MKLQGWSRLGNIDPDYDNIDPDYDLVTYLKILTTCTF